jgi:membrane-associated phospholipid phosphatase
LKNRIWSATVALIASGGVVAFRLLGTRSRRGRLFDVSAVRDGLSQLTSPRAEHATSALLGTISVTSLAVVGAGLILYALLQRRIDVAVACALLLLGAPATSEFLKHWLKPRTGVPTRMDQSFPSGHATIALSVGLALTFAAPASARALTAGLAAVYAAAIGVTLVGTGWHYPSDVAGGFCVATAWAAAAALIVKRPATARFSSWLFTTLVAVVLAASAATLMRHPGIVVRAQLHARFVEAAVGVVTVAGLCVAAFTFASLALGGPRAVGRR